MAWFQYAGGVSDERNQENTTADDRPSVVEKASETAQKVMAWFPVRVFKRFSVRNGPILAAGSSFQAFFAVAAAIYVALVILGLWLGASDSAIDGLINLINQYLPGLVDEEGGLFGPEEVREVVAGSASAMSITGVVALLAVVWTAIGWMGYVRKAVRDIFDLPPEEGAFALLKARDLLASLGFALLLLLGAVLSTVGTSTLNFALDLVGLSDNVWIARTGTQILAVIIACAINVFTLIVLFRFLTGTDLKTRVILPGACLGGLGLAILQLAAGFLLGKTPSNPLLAPFVVIIGLLLWFRLIMTVILLSAAWVAVSAEDQNIAIVLPTHEERALLEAETLRDAALVRYREARIKRAGAPWYARPIATREVRHWADRVEETRQRVAAAEEELASSGKRKVTVGPRR